MGEKKLNKYALKKRIYEVIEASRDGDVVSKCYDIMINIAVIVSMVPLVLKEINLFTEMIDFITIGIFILDYVLRIYTSDYKMGVYSYKAYIANALTFREIIDLLSILPVFSMIFPSITFMKLFKLFRVIRIFKLARYMKAMNSIRNVIIRVRKPLGTVLFLTLIYIFITAVTLFQMEPGSFNTFLDAFYWSTISLTTVGYGDFAPVTDIGKIIASISSLVGVAVIALPSSIITAAYMREITKSKGNYEL